MATFMNYSYGMKAHRNHNGRLMSLIVRVEFNREDDGSVTLRAKNARTMNDLPGVKTISAAEYEARPDSRDANGDVNLTAWALDQVGWALCVN